MNFIFTFTLQFTRLFQTQAWTIKIWSGNLANLKYFWTQREQNCHKLVNFCHIMLYRMFQNLLSILTSILFAHGNGPMAWKMNLVNGLITVYQSFPVHRCSIGTLISKRSRPWVALPVQIKDMMTVKLMRWKKSFNFSKSIM